MMKMAATSVNREGMIIAFKQHGHDGEEEGEEKRSGGGGHVHSNP
jgi:hypothetical protein